MKFRNFLIVGLVAALLTGCGATDAGSAANVAGTSISEAALADVLVELSNEVTAADLGISDAELTAQVLNRLVITELVRKLGAEAEVTVSETEIFAERSRIQSEFGSDAELIQAGLQQAIAPSLINSVFEISLYASKIGEKLEPNGTDADRTSAFESFLFSYVDSADIKISPRYGTWDKTQAAITPPSNPLVSNPGE
jgi:hypothetical protein